MTRRPLHAAVPLPGVLPTLLATSGGRLHRTLRDASRLAAAHLQASTDGLTGTANRRALLRRIEQVTAAGRPACLAVLDIDDFSTINDGIGQAGGDRLLVAVAQRLQGALDADHLLGRLGGDDFAVVASPRPGRTGSGPAELSRRLTEALAEPFAVDGLRLHLTMSAGLAAAATPAEGALLLARADAALRESKQRRTGPVVHDPRRSADPSGTLRLVEQLRTALAHDQLRLFVQPQADTTRGVVTGAEGLVRWQHPDRGLLGPADFVPLAEKHGLVGQLTERVLDLAVDQLHRWQQAGTVLRLSVNLSATNLLDDALPERVGARLAARGIPAGSLVLEITENVFVGDSARVTSVLQRLADLGCELSIDDYGTGYSSLGYLRQLPVRELKLDRCYTSDLLVNGRTSVIVRSTIDLAHALGLRVVAEGVEDEPTHARLAELGCDVVQGFWLARPMPAAELETWLARRTRPVVALGERGVA